jgi:hypothetical protein
MRSSYDIRRSSGVTGTPAAANAHKPRGAAGEGSAQKRQQQLASAHARRATQPRDASRTAERERDLVAQRQSRHIPQL